MRELFSVKSLSSKRLALTTLPSNFHRNSPLGSGSPLAKHINDPSSFSPAEKKNELYAILGAKIQILTDCKGRIAP